MTRVIERLTPAHLSRFVAYRFVIPAVHAGRRYECPCCGGTFRSFRAFNTRPNIRCPGCGSLERHRLIWLYLKDRTDVLTAPRSFLHLAPELTLWRRLSSLPSLDYVAGDLDPKNLGGVVIDLRNLQYSDEAFDVVLCSHVLEHVDDDRSALRELARVLKRGGTAIIAIPVDDDRATSYEDPSITAPEDREAAFGQHDHVRIYGRDFMERLGDAGLVATGLLYAQTIPPDDRDRYRLDTQETLYICVRTDTSA